MLSSVCGIFVCLCVFYVHICIGCHFGVINDEKAGFSQESNTDVTCSGQRKRKDDSVGEWVGDIP